ncbi:hypothetical protein JAAARDRAFT_164275 [Jaapia argillacea MUCL 33604]|uniref:Fungal-type protein kinase domain-containing protein n=1 Tax=Jaapia argillacea MUCL 33604 TaxID=933084 RepID=A0A067P7H9_9AGAM|nr:hypothetical protein JAAARDRAFT_164275 [Jaapia argillacea MUCL 33604]
MLHEQYSLLGRASRILLGHFALTEGPITPTVDQLAAKIYYPEESKVNEPRIIKLAIEAGSNDVPIKGNLPNLIDHGGMNFKTGKIEDPEDLGIENKGSGVLHVMSFEKLKPIQEFASEEFMKAWIQCYRSHFRLWLNGIEHGGISVSNLMVHPSTGRGVVNDFDLAVLRKKNGRRTTIGNEHIGKVPFMAIDLFCQEYHAGEIRRLFHHDCESFIWVMPWVLLERNPKELEVLNRWETFDYQRCREKKEDFLSRFRGWRLSPGPSNRTAWRAATELLLWVKEKVDEAEEETALWVETKAELTKAGKPKSEFDKADEDLRQQLWHNPSEKTACDIFREFEQRLQKRWAGFEVLSEEQTRPLKERAD